MPWVERTSVNWGHWDLSGWLDRDMPEPVLRRFAEEQDAFDIRFLEDLLARTGETVDLLTPLGYLYTQAGRYRDALTIDQRLAALRPRDATVFYNLACSYALLKRLTRGFAALKRAMELGYRDFDHMQADDDLENLRADPRWNDLVSVLRR
jgi:tetratricopeptide (TPR) repeat protein